MPASGTPIQQRLMHMLLVTSVTVLLLTCAAFTAYEYTSFRSHTLQQLSTIGKIVASNSTAALAFENPADAEEILAALAAEPHIVAAALYSGSGEVFAHYPAGAKPAGLPAQPGTDGLRFESGAAIGFIPVVQRGSQRLGTLYLHSDLGALSARLRSYALIALLVIAASLLVAVTLSSILQRQISHPILALTTAAHAISEQGDYSVRVIRESDDELGRLTDAFNLMLARIEAQRQALQESEAAFRDVAETMPQIVWTADARGRLDYHNQRWHDYAGTQAGLSGRSILHPEDYQACLDAWRKSITSGDRYEIEYRLRRASDGAHRWHIGRASPLRNCEGQIVRWIGTCTDIDDLKHAQSRLLLTLTDLRDRNRDLQDFAFVVSHDLQEPLRKIQIYSDRLVCEAQEFLPAPQLRLLERANRAAARLRSLIDGLIEYTGVRVIRQAYAPTNLDALLADVIGDLELRIEAAGARLVIGPLPNLPCDAMRMRTAFNCILSNALKFRDARRPLVVEISAHRMILDAATPGWEIRISDNGIGMEPDHTERIFTLFEQLHSQDSYEGTGTGLSVVRRIIEQHRGVVHAQGTPGVGSVFIIQLPA